MVRVVPMSWYFALETAFSWTAAFAASTALLTSSSPGMSPRLSSTYCLTAESARELATSPAWCPPIPSATANRLPDSRTASSFISRTFPVCVIEAELQWYICIPYFSPVSYTHLRAHETRHDLVCRLLLEKKKQ